MQEFMQTYKDNVDDIENFLIETVKNTGELSLNESTNFEKLYDVFPSLELVYICNKEDFIQISPNIYRDRIVEITPNTSRKYLLSKFSMEDKSIAVSQPYISSATGKTCISITKEENGKIYLLDFNHRDKIYKKLRKK